MTHERNSELRLSIVMTMILVVAGTYLVAIGEYAPGAALLSAAGVPVSGYALSRGIKKAGDNDAH